jgi:hypothetical protein
MSKQDFPYWLYLHCSISPMCHPIQSHPHRIHSTPKSNTNSQPIRQWQVEPTPHNKCPEEDHQAVHQAVHHLSDPLSHPPTTTQMATHHPDKDRCHPLNSNHNNSVVLLSLPLQLLLNNNNKVLLLMVVSHPLLHLRLVILGFILTE